MLRLQVLHVIRIHFDMPVRTVVANAKVADDNDKIAVERGLIHL